MKRTRLVSLFVPLALIACAADEPVGEGDEQALASHGEDAAEGASATAYALGYFEVDAADAASAVVAIEANVSADLEVPACVTADTDGATFIELTFADCVTRRGVEIDGSLRAELEVSADAIAYAVSIENLKINGTTISGSYSLDRAFSASVTTEWSGSTEIDRPNRDTTLESTASASWDGECLELDLAGTMEVSGAVNVTREIAIDGYRRCLGECPTAGEVTISSSARGEVSWTYDGGASATVTGRLGGTFEIPLDCDL
jgi:hypothetical protein